MQRWIIKWLEPEAAMKFCTDVDELEAFVCVSVLVNYTAVDVTRVSDMLWNMFRKPVYEGPGSFHIDSG